jgi:hypothetical protein
VSQIRPGLMLLRRLTLCHCSVVCAVFELSTPYYCASAFGTAGVIFATFGFVYHCLFAVLLLQKYLTQSPLPQSELFRQPKCQCHGLIVHNK